MKKIFLPTLITILLVFTMLTTFAIDYSTADTPYLYTLPIESVILDVNGSRTAFNYDRMIFGDEVRQTQDRTVQVYYAPNSTTASTRIESIVTDNDIQDVQYQNNQIINCGKITKYFQYTNTVAQDYTYTLIFKDMAVSGGSLYSDFRFVVPANAQISVMCAYRLLGTTYDENIYELDDAYGVNEIDVQTVLSPTYTFYYDSFDGQIFTDGLLADMESKYDVVAGAGTFYKGDVFPQVKEMTVTISVHQPSSSAVAFSSTAFYTEDRTITYESDGNVITLDTIPDYGQFGTINISTFYQYGRVTIGNYTSWLGDSIESIFSLELIPGLSLGAIFWTVVGVLLLIAFLRFFAGG